MPTDTDESHPDGSPKATKPDSHIPNNDSYSDDSKTTRNDLPIRKNDPHPDDSKTTRKDFHFRNDDSPSNDSKTTRNDVHFSKKSNNEITFKELTNQSCRGFEDKLNSGRRSYEDSSNSANRGYEDLSNLSRRGCEDASNPVRRGYEDVSNSARRGFEDQSAIGRRGCDDLANSSRRGCDDLPTMNDLEMILFHSDVEIQSIKRCLSTDGCDPVIPDIIVETKIQMLEEGGEKYPHQVRLSSTATVDEDEESYLAIGLQVFIPFIIAGFGTVGAGLVFNEVQHWKPFEEIPALVIMIPALLGLKGNLEMTLASRLSTQANLGRMDTLQEQTYMIFGNICLVQVQANGISFAAALVAYLMGAVKDYEVELQHIFLLCASSLLIASSASLLLGLLTSFVIIISRRCKINPDNVAIPIAASLGDITSLALLAYVADYLFYEAIENKNDYLIPSIIGFYTMLTPLWTWMANRNPFTRDVLRSGWVPIVVAMFIGSASGFILDFMVSRFEDLAVFSPVISGVAGSLVAVQASRISTTLHKKADQLVRNLEQEPQLAEVVAEQPNPVVFISFVASFFGPDIHAKTTRVLMSLVAPGHIIFIYVINYIKNSESSPMFLFTIVYITAASIQVAILLYVAYVMVHWMFQNRIDPDNCAIPYLTAMGDLLGISLLTIAFQFLYLVGDHSQYQQSEL